MKKTLKLAAMALFALPAMVFTACSDDENGDLPKDQVALFKDYSVLIDKDADAVIKYMGQDPYETDETDGTQTFLVKKENVDLVQTLFSDEDGIIYKKAIAVDSYLSDKLTPLQITNYLSEIYELDLALTEADEDGWIWFDYSKKNMRIAYISQEAADLYDELGNDVYYVKIDKTKAEDFDYKAFAKANRRPIKK